MEGAALLLAFMSTAGQAGPLRVSLRSTKGNEPRGTGSPSSLPFQVQASDLPGIHQLPVSYLLQSGHTAAQGVTPAWVPSFPCLLGLTAPLQEPGQPDGSTMEAWEDGFSCTTLLVFSLPVWVSGLRDRPAPQFHTLARCCPGSSTSHKTPFHEQCSCPQNTQEVRPCPNMPYHTGCKAGEESLTSAPGHLF